MECAIYPIGWVSALSVPLATAKVTLCNMGGSRIGGDLGALAHLNPFMPKAKGLARCTALPSIENSLRAPFWGAVILYRSDIIRSFLLLQRPRKAKAFFHPSVVPSPLSFYLRRSHAGQWVMFGFLLLRKIESLEAVRGQGSMAT